MSSLTNPDAHRSWINIAADRQHCAEIHNRGEVMAKLWDFTPEAAQARAEKLIELQRWNAAQVVLHAS